MPSDPSVTETYPHPPDGRHRPPAEADCPPATTHQARPAGLTDSQGAPTEPAPDTGPGVAPERAGRYEIQGEIDRGGMGVVLRARDPDLNRPLAIKILGERHRGNRELERRFREEAQITGRLQHPGVPPVHEVGVLPDGRPFFAMKLIQGRTLAQLLAERPAPAHDLPRFLAVFEQVCQTLAYAHSEGVIHRDLKPSNVMVGAFGEVQVMDWGLAKPLAGRRRQAPGSDGPQRAGAPGSLTETAAGAVLGTPVYMAPEQARGEVEQLDERCDVFGLGAILCEILTAKPPYVGTSGAVLACAARGDLARAGERLAACGGDPPLLELAWVCLAPQKEARPRHAGEVAQAVGAYLAGVQERVREAERQRAAAEARAVEERKRRRVLAALAAVVLLLVVAVGGGAWWYQQDRAAAAARREALDREALALLERARAKLEKGWQEHDLGRLREANAEADQAVKITEGGRASTAVWQKASALRETAARHTARAEKNQELLNDLLNVVAPRETPAYVPGPNGQMLALAEPDLEEQYAGAFRRWGLDIDRKPDAEVLARLRDEPEPVRQQVIAGLDSWAVARRQRRVGPSWRRLLRLAGELDRSAVRRQLRALLVGRPAPRAESVVALLGAWPPWPALAAAAHGEKWLRVRELRRQTDVAKEPALTVLLLARVCRELGDGAGAEEVLRGAASVRNEMVLLNALGALLERRRPPRLEQAIGFYRAVRALRPELGITLGKLLTETGQVAEGESVLRDLVARQPNSLVSHIELGNALSRQGRHKEAEAAYREAVRIMPRYPLAHYNLGIALGRQGRHKEAEAAYRQALLLKPGAPETHLNLGSALANQDRHREAEACYRRALRLKPEDPLAHYGLGKTLYRQGRYKEAEAAHRETLRLKPNFPAAHYDLGNALGGQHRYKEAEAALRETLRLRPDFPGAHYNLGNALASQARFREAEAAFRQALRLKPDDPQAHCNLGGALRAQGRFEDAEAACRQALRLKPDLPEAHGNLGLALRGQGKFREALDSLRKGHALGIRRPGRPNSRIVAYIRQLERVVALDEALPAVLLGKRKPSGAFEQLELAALCRHPAKRLYAASARFCADAFTAEPALADDLAAGHRYNAACAAALAGCGQGEGAGKLNEEQRASLRKQALDWLRADLTAWTKQVETDKPQARATALAKLTHWQKDADLVGVRDRDALAALPEAERAAWLRLWAEVAALRERAGGQ